MPQTHDQKQKSRNARKMQRTRRLADLIHKGREEQVPDMGPFLAAIFQHVSPESIAREVAKEITEGSPLAKRNWTLAIMKLLQQYHASSSDEDELDFKGLSDDELNTLLAGRFRVK